MENKWLRAAIPALLIHCSIGTVYCWSTIKGAIAAAIGMSTFAVGWAFSLAIFFLGMSAAFAGRIVELDIHKSSLVAAICFAVGMIGTGIVVATCTGPLALILIYLFYGCIMGIGLGVGYLTPVKTLMLWFKDNKGLATGISIMGFGLAKAIATPIMEILQVSFGIAPMLVILGLVYFVLMLIGHLLLKKPKDWIENKESNSNFKLLSVFKDKRFIGIWLMFFINIHCGLMLISYEKQILTTVFLAAATLSTIIKVVPSITAVSNALGRIGYSTISDKLKDRSYVYLTIFLSCIIICLIALLFNKGTAIILLLIIINLGYGGGFSTLPALLESRFGMENISKIHGLALSAWAVAGLTGNNLSEIVLSSGGSYNTIIGIMAALYTMACLVCCFLVTKKENTKSSINK